MRTNRIMDEIRSTITPEMKLQMEMSVAIANRIYEILEAKGMTQKELAQKLGKTETEVSRWLFWEILIWRTIFVKKKNHYNLREHIDEF